MTSYATKLSMAAVIPQPNNASVTWGTPKSFTSTGAGASDGSTIVSTSLASFASGDDDWVGQWVECVSASNAQNQSLYRRVLVYNHSSSTLTIDRLPAQVSDGDTFRLLVPPNPVWVEDTGGMSTAVYDVDRDEADDYWNGSVPEGGPYMETIKADNASDALVGLITDFTQAGYASVVLTSGTAIGDYFEAWQYPEEIGNAIFECAREDLRREVFTGNFFRPENVKGNKSVTGTKEYAFRGPGSSNPGGHNELHRILGSIFDANDTADLTANAGCTTSSVAFDAGTAETGAMYVTEEGDVFVSGGSSTPVTPEPNLVTAPAEDTTIVGLTTYTLASSINHHLAAKQYHGDGILDYIFGLVPQFTISGELGQFLKIAANYQGTDWYRLTRDDSGDITRAWQPIRSSVAPVRLQAMRLSLDDTSYSLKSFTFGFNEEYNRHTNLTAPNECDGFTLTGVSPSFELVCYADSTNREAIDEFAAGVTKQLLIQAGTSPGFPGVFALFCPVVQYTGCNIQDDSGKLTVTLSGEVKYYSGSIEEVVLGVG